MRGKKERLIFREFRHFVLWLKSPTSTKLVDQVILDCEDLYAEAEYANNHSMNVRRSLSKRVIKRLKERERD